LFRVDVEAVAADLHPGYLSSQWARQLAESLDVPFIAVQHHFAHAVSLIAEHQPEAPARDEHLEECRESNPSLARRVSVDDDRIIACCFDGTGYGTDGAIWGGEFMLANIHGFHRAAHLKYFQLPGGDASIKRPYRTALSLLYKYQHPWDERLPCTTFCPPNERRILNQQLDKTINCAPTSSMGRLFDAVAALIGVRQKVSYEAQAAMEMEAIASEAIDTVDPCAYLFEFEGSALIEIGCGQLLDSVCRDIFNGAGTARIAAQFHHAVANMVVAVCELIQQDAEIRTVGLTGGVFQNVLLLTLVENRLQERGFDVLSHTIVPPNDGGLALGQAIIARNSL